MNMKKATRGFMLATVFALSINSAFAVVSDQSMSALKARNWTAAEYSLKQDLKQDNQDPKVWYNLAQVLNHARKPEDAMKALNNAVHLDKTMSFARSRQNVLALRDTIQSNIKVVNNSQPVNNSRSTDNGYRVPTVSTPTSVAVNKPVSQVPVSQNKPAATEDKKSGGGGIFALILALICIGGAGFYFFSKNKEKKALKDDQNQKMVKLEEMFEDVSTKVDFIKAMDKTGTDLGRKMSSLKNDILSAKASNHVADYQFSELQSEYRTLVSRYDSEQYDAPVVASQPVQQRHEVDNDDSYSRTRSYSEDRSSYGRTESQRPRHDNNNGYNGGTTVINNHYGNSNNSSDMLTGIAVGSILSGAGNHSSHDTIIEREVVREQPRQDNYNYGNNTDDFASDNNDSDIQEFAGNSDSDWGNDSTDNNSSNDYQQADELDDFGSNDSNDSDDDWAR